MMVYRCIIECAGRSFLLAAWLTADEREHDVEMTSRMTEQHLKCVQLHRCLLVPQRRGAHRLSPASGRLLATSRRLR